MAMISTSGCIESENNRLGAVRRGSPSEAAQIWTSNQSAHISHMCAEARKDPHSFFTPYMTLYSHVCSQVCG
jgi:hypothetical protein